MDSGTLVNKFSSQSLLPDYLTRLFCFVESRKARFIEEQKRQKVYESQHAVELPHKINNSKKPIRSSSATRLIPLGRLQFSRIPALKNSDLSKSDVFRFYIWCGVGKLTEEKINEYAELLPAVKNLEEPSVLKVHLKSVKQIYIVDPSLKMVERAVKRESPDNYQPGKFKTPVVIAGRPLSWEEVSISHYSSYSS